MVLRRSFGAAFALAACAGGAARAECAPPSAGPGAVQALRDMFAAAARDDDAALRRIAAPDFHAYDNGRSFPGDTLFAFVREAHAKGLVAEWSVTEPKVSLDCSTALVTYVNRGAIGSAGALKPATWLESATLRYEGGVWRVVFLHSTREATAD